MHSTWSASPGTNHTTSAAASSHPGPSSSNSPTGPTPATTPRHTPSSPDATVSASRSAPASRSGVSASRVNKGVEVRTSAWVSVWETIETKYTAREKCPVPLAPSTSAALHTWRLYVSDWTSVNAAHERSESHSSRPGRSHRAPRSIPRSSTRPPTHGTTPDSTGDSATPYGIHPAIRALSAHVQPTACPPSSSNAAVRKRSSPRRAAVQTAATGAIRFWRTRMRTKSTR
ncbi:hypothetical protein GCM10010329_18860 [Streptomyces spiroverticillatus]|uniref:Uncharacterized protein n=1 Tax=Streptomyces finlayi TaxID=67296 RepID=A0A918WU40_9ACTN|nr:hypothetical protein GCM10010329_18860 [Streptomyces spiroverticillatus]GHC82801.1 hypothetical protein GCM10010334_11340 [Streptomyces finlayi]